MSIIPLIAEENAPEEVKAVFKEIRTHFGLDETPNSAKAFAHHPETLKQVWNRYKESEKIWGKETLFLVNLAIAVTRGCPYAINFDVAMLKQEGYTDQKVDSLINLIASTSQRYDYYNGLQLEADVTPDTVARKRAA